MVDVDGQTGQAGAKTPEARRGENVFQVLANNARRRTLGELGTTAVAGAVNAGFLWWRYPGVSWLAAGFAACSAYAACGLLDRSLMRAEEQGFVSRDRADRLRKARTAVAAVGTGAAVWALLRFMAAALGGWQH